MSRRDFLKASMGGSALGLAATKLGSIARANGNAPGRFVFLYTPAGRHPDWRTGTPGSDFKLGSTMQMFEP